MKKFKMENIDNLNSRFDTIQKLENNVNEIKDSEHFDILLQNCKCIGELHISLHLSGIRKIENQLVNIDSMRIVDVLYWKNIEYDAYKNLFNKMYNYVNKKYLDNLLENIHNMEDDWSATLRNCEFFPNGKFFQDYNNVCNQFNILKNVIDNSVSIQL